MINTTAIVFWAGIAVLCFHFWGLLGLGIALVLSSLTQITVE